jgi:methylated-DNA-[protein]-cysteine S-methyltransferase
MHTAARVRRTLPSPIGPLLLEVRDGAVTRLTMGSPIDPAEVDCGDGTAADVEVADRAERQLAEYFAGRRKEFDLPLAAEGTAFQHAVWAALRSIPCGQTRSYADVAAAVDAERASTLARAVGQANGANPIGVIVPCHRVVNASGSIGGYAGGLAAKHWLLRHEKAGTPELWDETVSTR